MHTPPPVTPPVPSKAVAIGLTLAVALMCHVVIEGVSVKVEHDKTFNFKGVRTWAWSPMGAGDVRMARTKDDDPERMKRRIEPILLEAVAAAMTRNGLKEAAPAATAAPDITIAYFLLLSTNMSAQTVGQFLPATVAWGLPPFAPATQSLTVMNQGSLVIDLSANATVIWRGVAEAKIEIGIDDKRRESLVREAVRDLLRKYPK
jgi:hypothetical protein